MSEPVLTVLPRPGASFPTLPSLPAPGEETFTRTFGALLPPATYLATPHGQAAYYFFPPSNTSTPNPSPLHPENVPNNNTSPTRVLLIHGVQTPALGLLPLIQQLRSTFPTTAFATLDLWGHGLTSTPLLPHTTPLFLSLIDSVLSALDWKQPDGGLSMIGYSFGAVLTMSYLSSSSPAHQHTVQHCLRSATLIAPAGLLRRDWFTPEQQGLLSVGCPAEQESEAAKLVLEILEDGPLVVPATSAATIAAGGVCAQAVKQWQLAQHPGHFASVVGIFRDAGVLDNEALFLSAKDRAEELGIGLGFVLGEKDGCYKVGEVEGLVGKERVRVVRGAGHAVVRERVGEVVEAVEGFWKGV